MMIEKKQALKKLTYICLSFTSIILTQGLYAQGLQDVCATDEFREDAQSRIPQMRQATSRVKSDEKLENEANIEPYKGHTYDLVGVALFSGNDPVSDLIKAVTFSKTSHVGMVLSDEDGKLYCFESTGKVSEVLHGNPPNVRLTPLNKVVNHYGGKVSYRKFVFPDAIYVTSDKVTEFVREYDGTLYTRNPLRLTNALAHMNGESRSEVLKTAFCSELVAKMLMELDVLDDIIHAGNYIPKDFAKEGDHLSLKAGITLSSKIKLKKMKKKKD